MTGEAIPDGLAQRIHEEVRRSGIAGAAVAAFDRDAMLWSTGFGTADYSRCEPVKERTAFRCASVTKLVVAALILRLCDEGRLSLDEGVNEHLPEEVAIRGANPTLGQLLSHTSGLSPSLRGTTTSPVLTWISNDFKRGRTLVDAVRDLHVGTNRTRITYSNAGYNVLGLVAARIRGASFGETARQDVLAPLGMARTDFQPQRTGPGVATPYGRVLTQTTRPDPVRISLWAAPMGGMWSDVEDLSRLGRMWLRGGELDGVRVLEAETVAAATTDPALNHALMDTGFGRGPFVSRWRGRRLVGHDGSLPGSTARLVWLPDDGVGVAVLANTSPPAPSHRIASMVLEEMTGATAPCPARANNGATDLAPHRAVEGSWEFLDWAAPGLIDTLFRRMPATIRPTGDGSYEMRWSVLGDEPAHLEPDVSRPGTASFTWRHPWNDGVAAVLEGDDLWIGTWHGQRRKARSR